MKQMFSKYQLQIVEKNKFCLGKNEKLIPNLAYKKILKLHYKKPKMLFKASIKIEKNMEQWRSDKQHSENHIWSAIQNYKSKQKKKATKSRKKHAKLRKNTISIALGFQQKIQ